MRRRNFIAGLASTTAVWPIAARAQQPPIPFIGLLVTTNVPNYQLRSIQKGLKEGGFIEGRNLAVMYRSADGQFDLLPSLANDLVASKVSVILASWWADPRACG
jgi:putative tryptophan/tyrosine transport system substrate-binding protein